MKITCIANIRIPTEKAHGIQIMKMCEAFSNAGNDVELVVPRRLNFLKENPFEYYGVRKNFQIIKLPTLDLVKFGKIGFWIQSISFAVLVSCYALFKKADIIYSRDELPLWFLSFFKKNLVLEIHVAKKNFISRRVFKKVFKIISITQGLKNFYVGNFKMDEAKIVVAPDGVDLEKFDLSFSKKEIREKLDLPLDKKIVLYTGHLYFWKGIDTLIEAGKLLNKEVLVYLVGGTEKDINEYRQKIDNENVILKGAVLHEEIPYWQKSADVLVLPNTAKEDISKYYTSPMKLFEYMASGNPIVASNLPSIREILNKNNSVLVEPDNSKKLAEGINKILEDFNFAEKISKQARKDVENYTWEKRVKSILQFIK